jgi:hypothetical protein
MLRRIGYRRVLPIANLLLYLALVGYGDWGLLQNVRLFRDIDATRISHGETAWDPIYIDRPTPLPKVLASSINFPAVLFALPFGAFRHGWRAELLEDVIAAFYLLLLWYAVGRWIDFHASTRVRDGHVLAILRRTSVGLASLAGIGILLWLLVGLTRFPSEWPNIALSLPALFWPTFLAYVARWELRAAKKNRIEVPVA